MAHQATVRRRPVAVRRHEAALGYRFTNPDLLAEALRHRSAARERQEPSFERLEFLGDAALSHAVAALLFARWPKASEGELTRARAALVRERTLATLTEQLGVAAALEVGSGLAAPVASPALLADALEAVLGALLLDGGWRTFRAVVRRLVLPLLTAMDPSRLADEEPKSTLQELAQKRGLPLPAYHQVEVRGPAHAQMFVFEVEFDGKVLARGEGSSKKEAQQQAARLALEWLEER